MEDFDRAAQRKMGDTTRSVHLAYHMFLSTRDMARLGYLMLRGGNWKGCQLVPRDWVALTTKPATRVTEMHPNYHRVGPFGYGYIWWVWDGAAATGPFRGAYTAQGAIGQFITVLPAVNLVIAHKTRPDPGKDTPLTEYLGVVRTTNKPPTRQDTSDTTSAWRTTSETISDPRAPSATRILTSCRRWDTVN